MTFLSRVGQELRFMCQVAAYGLHTARHTRGFEQGLIKSAKGPQVGSEKTSGGKAEHMTLSGEPAGRTVRRPLEIPEAKIVKAPNVSLITPGLDGQTDNSSEDK
jgi:hypothetical protein